PQGRGAGEDQEGGRFHEAEADLLRLVWLRAGQAELQGGGRREAGNHLHLRAGPHEGPAPAHPPLLRPQGRDGQDREVTKVAHLAATPGDPASREFISDRNETIRNACSRASPRLRTFSRKEGIGTPRSFAWVLAEQLSRRYNHPFQ